MSAYRPSAAQFAGCLIGQCLGDALGFPVEGQPRAVCARYVVETLHPENTAPRGRTPFAFGQYTDDSQLARELMLSLVERRGFDPAGNGSAMRAAPIGLFFWNRPAERVRAAHDQGRITHADLRCSAGAAAIAGAVARALRPGEVNPDAFLADLGAEVAELDTSFADHLHQLRSWSQLPPDEAVLPISRAGLDPSFGEPWDGISAFVVGSVLWSLYAFLRSPDDWAGPGVS